MALIHALAGLPGAGKSQAALSLAGDRVVFFAPTPDNANPLITAIHWEYIYNMTDQLLPELKKKFKRFRVVVPRGYGEELKRFQTQDWKGWTFIFDDFPKMFLDRASQNLFVDFAVDVRHRGSSIIITTQALRWLTPFIRESLADQLEQIGPVIAREEAWKLYQMGASAYCTDFKAFYKAISTNKKYVRILIKKS